MDNQNHCMSIKQTRLIVNAHKHYLLINSYSCFFYMLLLGVLMNQLLRFFFLTEENIALYGQQNKLEKKKN